ncbi:MULTISPECIES: hypothetical protein [unclassified Sinorhizobium]|uniref:hypothetical protein n=1 Tax=unclassified Sinorhizobium TaxID=2613772 RepID=UPI0035253664
MTISSNWKLNPWLKMFREMHAGGSIAGIVRNPGTGIRTKSEHFVDASLPTLVSHCISPLDLMRTIEFAVRCGLPLAVCHDQPEAAESLTNVSIDIRRAHYDHLLQEAETARAIIADLSAMRGVHVDVPTQIATAGASASTREVTAAASRFRLSPAGGGKNPSNLVDLLATGGFTPFLGDTSPAPGSLVSAQIVLPGCRMLNASAFENTDIFRAIRNGECDFGVVTSYQFRLETTHERRAGLIFFAWSELERVVNGYMRVTASAPPELSLSLGILVGANGERTIMLAPSWSGDQARGQQTLLQLQDIGTPLLVVSGDGSALATMALHDTYLRGRRSYDRSTWKVPDFSPEAILHLAGDQTALPPFSTVLFHPGSGAFDRHAGEAAEQREHPGVEIISPAGSPNNEWMKQFRHRLSRLSTFDPVSRQGAAALRRKYDPNGELSLLLN